MNTVQIGKRSGNGNGSGAAVLEAVSAETQSTITKQVNERASALEWGFQQITFAALSETSDWAEALEIGRQRMERMGASRQAFFGRLVADKPDSELSKEFAGYLEQERKFEPTYARFAEIYAAAFEPLEGILQAARDEAAAQIVAEFPESKDATDLAKHLQGNTPREWLGNFDSNEL
jgi:hypothetical protein